MIRFGEIWEIFKVLAREGGLAVIHAEDDDIVHAHVREAVPRGPHRLRAHGRGAQRAVGGSVVPAHHPPRRARRGHGALHDARERGLRRGGDRARARARGYPIYGETLHQYLLYTREDYKRPNGQIYHTYPSLKSKRDQQGLWDGLQNGHLHCVGTDEVCCNLSVKVRGSRIDDTTGGNAGVEPRVA